MKPSIAYESLAPLTKGFLFFRGKVLDRIQTEGSGGDPEDSGFNPKFLDDNDTLISMFEQKKGAERTYVKEHKFEFDRVCKSPR